MIFKPQQQEIPQLKPLLKEPIKRKKPLKGNRWTIVWLFLATLLATFIFYLKTELPLFWQKTTAPLVLTNIAPEKKFDPTPVLSEIQNLTKDLLGIYGVYVYRLESGLEYGFHQKEIFPAASLIKLPVILTLYQESEAGPPAGEVKRINLETKYKLMEQDKTNGAGLLQSKPNGLIYTYRQLAELMGQFSDNTAFRAMRRILGEKKIETTIKSLGMNQTSLAKNETTPEDMGIFFKRLYGGEVVTNEHRNEILKFLTKTAFEDWLPAGVPPEIKVSHKIGKDLGTFSDGGLVFAPKPFVLVIMSKDANEAQAVAVLPKITKAVWEFENK